MYGYTDSSLAVDWKSTSLGNQKIFYIDEKEINLEDIIQSELPPVPLEVTYTGTIYPSIKR